MRARGRPVALVVAAIAGCACDGDSGDASAVSAVAATTTASTTTIGEPEPPPTIAPTPPTTAPPTTPAPPTTVLDPACLQGVWAVTALTAQNGNLQFVGPVTGMTMSFGDGTWTLVATAATVYVEVRDIPSVAILDGEATGLTMVRGGRLMFQFAAAVGTATAEADGLPREMSFEELLVAMGPTGEASITCGPRDAVVATRTTSLQLERVD